ncbi:hypothetical protein TNCV_1168891 [Trichonephila clavipes]|uniref:Uncharacterized protein n=1 Tax=Trichonephila clavipes TaxID=2585209 RepID=A0A8X6T150_TRICX|nr:hypothetical protein TNCV_1168891 [Trichonephila clavipes]
MTENDAPESTRARIGFLSIITSSWLPVILAVDGGFQYKRPHLLGRSLCLVFHAPTAWRLTGSAIWRRGSVTTYWGSASRGTWRKTARRVWSAYFFFSANVVGFRRRFRVVKRQPFSLGSSALHVQDVRSGNKQVCCQSFSTHLFFLVQVGIFEQELCIS